MKTRNKITNCMLLFAIALIFTGAVASEQSNLIVVDPNTELGAINKLIFGNNFIAYDPLTYEKWPQPFYGYSDYGAGIWNPKKKEPVQEVIELAKNAGIASARFPGGCGAHHYNWEDALGEDRAHFLYGIDEFISTCTRIGAEPVITVSFFTGDENDAAELVGYLTPHNVKYYEIGNEVWHGDHRKIRKVSAEQYAKKYLKYFDAMKAANPSIKIGAIFGIPGWDKTVAAIIKDKVDFGILHMYPAPGVKEREIPKMDTKDIFRKTFARTESKLEPYIQSTLQLLREESGKEVPLAITEYNGGFTQNKPVPYRHTLGTALANADFLAVLMKPDNRVLMAHYWQFSNSFWGMIYTASDYMTYDYTKPIRYIKRPSYYVFELYNKHFGDTLISVEMKKSKYLNVNASKSKNTIFLMVVNKSMEEPVTATIKVKGMPSDKKVSAWTLNGPSIDATNENNTENVGLRERELSITGDEFTFTFEPHSLTALEIDCENAD